MTTTDLAFSAVADHVLELVQLVSSLENASERHDSVMVSAISKQIDVKLEDIKSHKNTAVIAYTNHAAEAAIRAGQCNLEVKR